MEKQEIKAFTEVIDGKMVAIASDESIDRTGDVIKVKDWDFTNFKNNPVLQAGHDYRPQFTIGVAKNIRVDGAKVLFEPVFHTITQLAREVKKMFEEGILKAWSVGFIPASKSGEKHELLEVSAVAVPANANALIAAKGMQLKEEKAIGEKINNFVDTEIKEKVDKIKDEEKKDGKQEDKINKDIKPAIRERWNINLSKSFDVESVERPPCNFEYDLFTKFLDCKIKDIFLNNFLIPSPLLGTYLAGYKQIFSEFKLKDTRSFTWSGDEAPPVYEVIQLNSEKSDDFLIEGTNFYVNANDEPLMLKFQPTWYGLNVSLVTTLKNKKYNKELMVKVEKWVKENNYLKGEKFALNGEFLPNSEKDFDDVILEKDVKNSVIKSVKFLNDKKENSKSRGILFLGEPGTGKTQTGKVIMEQAKSTFIWVSSRDFQKIDPIRALSLSFKLARDLAPSVLFLEDIDTWLRNYTIDLLKTEMDGIRENKGMLTILTSNFPEKLPKALIDRPGRFHDVLDFKVPNKELRKEMLNKWVDGIEEKLLTEIIEKTEGYSGAYIKELVDFAEMIKDDDDIDIGKALLLSLEKIEKQRDLVENLQKKEKSFENIDEKEGRVISKKNKIIINTAIEAEKSAVDALEKLLNISDSIKIEPEEKKTLQQKQKGTTEIKVENSKKTHKELTVNELAVRTLKTITKQTNFALNRLNNKMK